MSVGVRELDEQHRELFALLNAEIEALGADRTHDEILAALGKIADYNRRHLKTEENYMTEFGCPSPEHIEAHRMYSEISDRLMAKAQKALLEGADTGVKFAVELLDFTGHWHVQHISTVDTTYTKCFNDHGLR